MHNGVQGKLRTFCALLAFALLALTLVPHITAQDGDNDPPGRAGRLGHTEGSISFQPAGESEWVEAIPNRPITTGDKLWCDRDSRAEVELGSTSIHLGSNTGFSFLNLDDHTVQIQLSAGTINVRVRHLDDDNVVEIDTPNQAFSVLRPGSYKVKAIEDGNFTMITVREGEGESAGNGQTFKIHEGQTATLSGTDRLNADIQQAADEDELERWSNRRDRHFEDSVSARYVSRDVVGADDLDEYGEWHPTPGYGPVWYPNVAPGWAPYHTGHWAWVDPWGWTWVDDSPWGYAPFHYGRWAFVEGRWGWVPGPREVRPVYAPALVVFVGGGGSSMGGNVAWFPLGPREVYVPSYHASPRYVNSVNVSNTTVNQTTVTNVYNTTIVNNTTVINNTTYANRNVSGAVTAVPQQAFAGGQPVTRTAVAITRQQIASAPVAARVAVAPSQSAVLGVHAATTAHVAAPPAALVNRPVIAKIAPPPAPVSFAAKQQALSAHPGQPVASQEMQRIRPANAPQPLVRQLPSARPAGNAQRPDNQPIAEHFANPQPNHPQPNQPMMNRPSEPNRPPQPNTPAMNRPSELNRPAGPPEHNGRPAVLQPVDHTVSSTPMKETQPSRQQQNPPAPIAVRPPQPQQHPKPAYKPQGQDDKKHQDHQ